MKADCQNSLTKSKEVYAFYGPNCDMIIQVDLKTRLIIFIQHLNLQFMLNKILHQMQTFEILYIQSVFNKINIQESRQIKKIFYGLNNIPFFYDNHNAQIKYVLIVLMRLDIVYVIKLVVLMIVKQMFILILKNVLIIKKLVCNINKQEDKKENAYD
ncbi:unnamed protein product [Paramecium sonneborni]|uniref:Transmembrane protein n=1 Tax=Paramecium sonneborni TaxID=65129 RepID=A0A8S1RRA9_9CILI|nr:unnamed protein product [Paramecium sonneborni]